jgi:hypothetical protein
MNKISQLKNKAAAIYQDYSPDKGRLPVFYATLLSGP